MKHDERVVLVTGANKGLGKEVVRQLAGRGFVAYLGSRDGARGSDAARDLQRGGCVVTAIDLDVTDAGSVARAAARIGQEHGRLDVLINNAGIHVGAPALDISVDDMRKTYETNVFGVVCVTRAMLPLLQRSTSPRIVNVASTTASHALTCDPASMFSKEDRSLAYASSKAAVTMLTVQYANAFRRRPEYKPPAGAAAAGPPPTTGSNGPSAVTTASAPTTTSASAPVAAPPAPTNDVAHS